MNSFRSLYLLGLFFLASCKGHRFYWESRFTVTDNSPAKKEVLIKKYGLTGKLHDWHPVFGQYCAGLPSVRAHLFVCWKGNLVTIASSYEGVMKGDESVRKSLSTVSKYLKTVEAQPGYSEHNEIADYIHQNYRVKEREDRLLSYGRGSVLMKEELDEKTP